MLNEFRSIAGGFGAKLLLALLVLSFAVWGIGDMVRHPGSSRTVATVGGVPIYIETYQAAARRQAEALRRSLGDNYTPEMLKALQPEKQALQQLIRQNLVHQESNVLGIVPSDADIVKRIRANPNFQDDKGHFDKVRLEIALKNNHISEKAYVERLRQDLATGLILDTLSVKKLPVPDIAVKTLYDVQEEQRGVTVYTLDAAEAGSVAPKAGELEAFFNQHKQDFVAEEQRSVSYATVNPEDARNKIDVSDEALLAAYKDRIDEFKRPERREVEQLLFANEQDAQKASDALQSGKRFDDVAKSAPLMNKGSTSLGKVEHDRVLDVAADEVFSLPENGVTKPVQSAFGWHIFHVQSIDPPSTAPFNEVKKILEKDVAQQLQDDAQTRYLNRLEDTLAGGATLSETAKEFGLKVQSVGPLLRTGATAKLPQLDKFLDTAFATPEKTESALIGSKGGLYYVLRVEKVTPERQRSLDEVRAEVTAAWQKDARAKRLADIADAVAKKFADKATREKAIGEYHLSPTFTGTFKRASEKAGGLAIPRTLVNDVFKHDAGESTGAYLLPSGGYGIAVVGKRTLPESMDTHIADGIRKSLGESLNKEVTEEYLRYLEQKHPVEINEKVVQALSNQSSD